MPGCAASRATASSEANTGWCWRPGCGSRCSSLAELLVLAILPPPLGEMPGAARAIRC